LNTRLPAGRLWLAIHPLLYVTGSLNYLDYVLYTEFSAHYKSNNYFLCYFLFCVFKSYFTCFPDYLKFTCWSWLLFYES